MAAERGWRSILTAVPLTAPDSNISVHPQARLDARVARLENARQKANQLHMQMQHTEMKFQSTLAEMKAAFAAQTKEIEEHYHRQLDSVQSQYKAAMEDVSTQYRDAYYVLRREQQEFAEQAKHIDFKGEFIDHLPSPDGETKLDNPRNTRPQS